MRALKILVMVMGIMLVGGFAALIAAIAMRASQTRLPATPIAAPALELPAGARIESMALGNGNLALEIVLADGNRQLRLLDTGTGRTVMVIPLRTEP